MKIQINQIPSTFNYGSLMMAVNTIKKLEAKNIEIYVDTVTQEDLDRLKLESGIDKIFVQPTYKDLEKKNKFIKLYCKAKRDAKFYDKAIFLGGDDISEYYSHGYVIKKLLGIYMLARKIDTFLIGQTIGPFTGYRRTIAKIALNKTKIYTRDDKCLKYLEDMGVVTAKKGRDLAFSELPNKNNRRIFDLYNLKENQYITIVPSGLIKWYTNDLEAYYSEQAKIISNIINNDKMKDKKVVLLPHVTSPKTVDDRIVIKELRNRLNKEVKENVIFIMEEMLASEAREVLGKGLFTITGRMHAAVSTFYMLKPAISLSYSVKYSGVIGMGLNMMDLVIESADDELWKGGAINKLVNQKIEYVLSNYNKLIDEININVSRTNEIVEEELNSFVSEILK